MKDRQLLELAAKAFCNELAPGWRFQEILVPGKRGGLGWDPLTDDGDALRLAACLKFCVDTNSGGEVVVWAQGPAGRLLCAEPLADDRLRAVRYAIVHAAAEIGRAMP